MSYQVEDPHADHPGYDARECPLSLKVTQRSPWGPITRAGFSCLMTGGHCLPGEHCDDRRKRETEIRQREAEAEAARAARPMYYFPQDPMPMKTPRQATEVQTQAQNRFIDLLRGRTRTPSDAQLGKRLGESVVVISRCRAGTALVGSALVLRVLEAEVLTLAEVRLSLGPEHPFNAKREAP